MAAELARAGGSYQHGGRQGPEARSQPVSISEPLTGKEAFDHFVLRASSSVIVR